MFQRVSGQLREVSTVGLTYTRKICGANIKYKNKSNVKLPSGQANSGQQASGGRKLSKIAHPL